MEIASRALVQVVALTAVSMPSIGARPPTSALAVSVTGGGVVTSDPGGISCPSDCNEPYAKGARIILTASPSTHQTFVGWGGACAGTSTTCSVNVSSPQTAVTAAFTYFAWP